MNWTVSRRIAVGFGLVLFLVLVTALTGIWALERSKDAYENAMRAERERLVRAYDARGTVRAANISFLRYLLDRDPAQATARDTAVNESRRLFQLLEGTETNDELTSLWSEALRLLQSWDEATRAAVAATSAGNQAEAMNLRTTIASPTRRQIDIVLERALAQANRLSAEAQQQATQTADASQIALWIALAIVLIVGAVSAWALDRAVTRPLQETSTVLASSAAEILAATTQQASGATESMAAVTETAATVDEVLQTAEQAAERARGVATSAQRAAEIGRQGHDAVAQSTAAMQSVRGQVESIGENIVALANQAQAIGEIITTVTELAEQTNLLALNAAIEAARAGEQGRGFGVVASEIKNLADQSKTATVRVREILSEIQSATSAAVMSTERGTKRAVESAQQAEEAGSTIRTLADAVSGASQAAAQISASAGQQSAGMEQIRTAIANIQQAAQQNLAATRQAEAAAQDLNTLGTRLLDLVGGRRNGTAAMP